MSRAGYSLAMVASYVLAMTATVLLAIRGTGWSLVYTLDDPYIHLAIAEVVLQGGYGINLEQYSSPSSSIAYPFILALTMALGWSSWGPLLLGVGANTLTLWVVARFIWDQTTRDGETGGNSIALILILPLILVFNTLTLPLTGMEHPLHILSTVAILIGLTKLSDERQPPWWLIVAIVANPLMRFEGLALSGAAILVLTLQRRWRAAAITAAALAILLGAYFLAMTRLGLPLLPSSVMMKSSASASAVGSDVTGLYGTFLRNIYSSLNNRWGVLFAVAIATFLPVLLVRPARREPPKRQAGESGSPIDARRAVAFAAASALGAHMALGAYGWFGRYEVYAVAVLVISFLFVWPPKMCGSPRAILTLALAAFLTVVAAPYAATTFETPAAARNVYQQQYQMHRFATGYFRHSPAVNDIGWVAYRNDRFVLDLWGLGSEEARLLAQSGTRDPASVDSLARRHGVQFAMIYDSWLGDAVPASWCRIAELRTSRVTSADDTVAFYLVNRARAAEMMAALQAFAPTLPGGSSLSMSGCAGG